MSTERLSPKTNALFSLMAKQCRLNPPIGDLRSEKVLGRILKMSSKIKSIKSSHFSEINFRGDTWEDLESFSKKKNQLNPPIF